MWLAVLALALASCTVVQTPERIAKAVVPIGNTPAQPDPAQVQIQIQRFADDFTGRTMQAFDDFAARSGTEAGYVQALRLKLAYTAAMIGIASGPNPNINLLDAVTVSTLMRLTVEDYWLKTPGGTNFQAWLDQSRILETNAWQLAESLLKPPQIGETRSAIADWYNKNPELQSGFLARPQEFATKMREAGAKSAGIDNVFGLVGLDPTAGLDPAVREVTRTRLFAERAMFTLQRMPFLIRWQTELMAYELADLSQVRQLITNTTTLSASVEQISRTAAALPDQVTAERKAILDALEQQEGKLRELSLEVSRTLESGTKMSDSLNTTITTFDGLMKRFGVGEPTTDAAPDTNSPPFNILDYGKVAGQIADMAKEVNTLLATADRSAMQLTRLSDEATARLDRSVDRAFHRGVALCLIFLAGAVVAGLSYRVLSRKLTRD